MRFAWLRENDTITTPVAPQTALNRFILIIYNAVWWVPILFTVTGLFDTYTGFWTFAAVTAIRAAANLYRNNFLPVERGEYFPFRTP